MGQVSTNSPRKIYKAAKQAVIIIIDQVKKKIVGLAELLILNRSEIRHAIRNATQMLDRRIKEITVRQNDYFLYKKILPAQQFILESVYRITSYKIDAFQWKVTHDEIYQLIIYRNGMKSVLSFSEEELLGYGSKGWINRIFMKIERCIN